MNLLFHKIQAHLYYRHSQLYHHRAMVEGYKFLMTGIGTVSLYHIDQVLRMLKQTGLYKLLMVINIHSLSNNFIQDE